MSFVNNEGGEQEDGLGGDFVGLELPQTDPPLPPTPSTPSRRDEEQAVPYGQRVAKKPLKRLFLGSPKGIFKMLEAIKKN